MDSLKLNISDDSLYKRRSTGVSYNLHMQYRFLGPTGIKVSVISYGNWVNSNSKEAQELTNNCVKQAWDLGINFFDTA
jgi:hypothetical protein